MNLPEIITSRTNPTVKFLASLAEKKYRESNVCFLCEGEKLYAEALRAKAPLSRIVLREDREELLSFAMEYARNHP